MGYSQRQEEVWRGPPRSGERGPKRVLDESQQSEEGHFLSREGRHLEGPGVEKGEGRAGGWGSGGERESCVRGSHAQSLVRTQSLVRSFPGMLTSLLSYQEHFDAHWGQRYFEQHQHVPVLAICLYLAGVYFGPRWMASRRPVRLVAISRVWNASLALFSICGVAACVPTLVGHLWHRGFHHSVCADCYELAGTGAPALWAVLFCFSKLAELFDTALLVLKKRPLLLLHWFHHPSVIAFTCERDAARALVRVDELLGARGHVLILLRNLLRPPRAARRVKKVRKLERHVPSRRPSPRAYSPRCGADPVSSVLPASLYADRAATWLRLKNFDATLEDCAVAIYAAGAPTR